MKLINLELNKLAIITKINNDFVRFKSYGFFVGQKIKVVARYKTMMVVEIYNSLYAINDSVYNLIEVSYDR